MAMQPRSNWIRSNTTSRRAVLGGLGASALLAPFFPIMNASGQEGMPARLVLWFTPHGTIHKNWQPTGTVDNFELSPILKPLEAHKSQLNILDNVQVLAPGVGAPHTKGPPLLWTASPLIEDMTFTRADGSGGMYYGWNSAPSMDQVLVERLEPETPYKSLEFGVRSGRNHPGQRMIYSGPEQPLEPQDDPWAALENLFADLGQQGEAFERLKAERLSVLDVVNSELNAALPKVPADDRLKVEGHLQAVRDIEMRLQANVGACTKPTLGEPQNADAQQNVPTIWQAQSELMAAALGCDLTRVMSLQYRVGENDGMNYDFLGINKEHHITTHTGDSNDVEIAELTEIYTWYSEQFAYFLDQLAAIPEGTGSVLDNTLVVWGSELGKGNSHSFEKTPFVVAGGKNLGLPTGRFLQFDNVEHNRLLVSLFHLMGVGDVNTFGGTDVAIGPLQGLV